MVQQQLSELREAICPRVAARLTALERGIEQIVTRPTPYSTHGVLKRLSALEEMREPILPPNTQLPRDWRVMTSRSDEDGCRPAGHPISSFERMQRYKKVQQIAREVLGDNHSFEGTYGDIEVIVRRK